jgi:hypothetical protein
MTGTFSAGVATLATGSTIGNLTLADGSITDSGGAISFGNETLTTTGSITGNSFITASDIGRSDDTDLIQLTAADTLQINGVVGIGVTPTNAKLHVYRNASIGTWGSLTVNNATVKIVDSGNTMYMDGNAAISSGDFYIGTNGAAFVSFGTNDTEALRINSSQNIGFQTSDIEAWSANYNAIEATTDAIMFRSAAGQPRMYCMSNAYYDGAWKFKTADGAAHILIAGDVSRIDFNVADADGASANDPITWRTNLVIERGEVVVNQDSYDVDFRVESNGNANALFVDGGTSFVGINGVPAATLDVTGTDGIIVPIGTTAQRVALQGIIRYNTDTSKFEGYTGAAWVNFH